MALMLIQKKGQSHCFFPLKSSTFLLVMQSTFGIQYRAQAIEWFAKTRETHLSVLHFITLYYTLLHFIILYYTLLHFIVISLYFRLCF